MTKTEKTPIKSVMLPSLSPKKPQEGRKDGKLLDLIP